jgi:hypothetical protein
MNFDGRNRAHGSPSAMACSVLGILLDSTRVIGATVFIERHFAARSYKLTHVSCAFLFRP